VFFLDGFLGIGEPVARLAQVFIDAVAQFHHLAFGLVGRGLHQLLGVGDHALEVRDELFLVIEGGTDLGHEVLLSKGHVTPKG
jgi:hypothetical protein